MEPVMESTAGIVDRLRANSDAKEKAVIAGLIRKPFHDGETKQECGNCIYYLSNHRFCDLPELQFPVDPDWWCRLWRN
jgi:hypothetical protein